MKSSIPGIQTDSPILVVDDFSTMRKIVKGCLNELGFSNIVEADDGVSAMTKLKQDQFQLIIADWKMPNMMGIDLLKAVRADERYKSVPFVMVTAEGVQETMGEAIKAGASNFVIKPLTAEALKVKLNEAFVLSPKC